jgi:hypothetical protein
LLLFWRIIKGITIFDKLSLIEISQKLAMLTKTSLLEFSIALLAFSDKSS